MGLTPSALATADHRGLSNQPWSLRVPCSNDLAINQVVQWHLTTIQARRYWTWNSHQAHTEKREQWYSTAQLAGFAGCPSHSMRIGVPRVSWTTGDCRLAQRESRPSSLVSCCHLVDKSWFWQETMQQSPWSIQRRRLIGTGLAPADSMLLPRDWPSRFGFPSSLSLKIPAYRFSSKSIEDSGIRIS